MKETIKKTMTEEESQNVMNISEILSDISDIRGLCRVVEKTIASADDETKSMVYVLMRAIEKIGNNAEGHVLALYNRLFPKETKEDEQLDLQKAIHKMNI